MKPILAAIALACLSLVSYAQKPLVIKVEKLSKPERTLRVLAYNDILKNLIRANYGVTGYPPARQALLDPKFNIVAQSTIADSLVSFRYGGNPFFLGMYNAYADHRPFTLSPDMMWLVICQGFAAHVNNNSESLRPLFVNFTGKTTLTVQNDKLNLDNPNSPWPDVFPEFSKQIGQYTGQELTDALTANFSTTTPTTKVASQITALYAMKSYFDLVTFVVGCGIPRVTLEGTPADWQTLLEKTEVLRKYKLDWWVDKLEPVLKQIIAASKGKKDPEFWRTMFKYHEINKYGAKNMIDGWIVKFYPYTKSGYRLGLDSLTSSVDLPDEMVKVDLKYVFDDGAGKITTTPLELWAGFVGLKQNNKDFNLRPEIGWMIRKKDTTIIDKKIARLKAAATGSGVEIRASVVPDELLEIGPINSLSIYFPDRINITEKLAKVSIKRLKLSGKIDSEEIRRIKKMFPNTTLIINNNEILNNL